MRFFGASHGTYAILTPLAPGGVSGRKATEWFGSKENDDGPTHHTRDVASMTMRTDHKALLFVGVIGVLGAGVRVVRASTASTNAVQPALEHQIQAADSSAKAAHAPKGKRRKSSAVVAVDSSHKAYGSGPLDRPGYIGTRLDLDVATAAQIDSLPGVTPTMARRIVTDRMMRGPFLSRDGLRRVTGAGPKFIASIDSLITFSGTVLQPNPADTIIPRRARSRARAPKRPP